MNISSRLQKIIDTIETCETLADIGCDHGYVAISALRSGRAKRAIAADVAKGPLDIARRNCEAEQVGDRVSTVLSDGFSNIPDSADINCAVIAGMGGLLMERLLREGRLKRFPQLRQLVLSPQSDLDAVRRLLIDELSYTISTEYMVLDEGKYYYIMDVHIPEFSDTEDSDRLNREYKDASLDSHRQESCEATGFSKQVKATVHEKTKASGKIVQYNDYTEAEYMFGKHIAAESRDIYLEFLKHRQRIVAEALGYARSGTSDSAKSKVAALGKELRLIEEAQENCI